MFYILENENIVLFDSDKEKLENTIAFMPQYEGLEVLETQDEIVELEGKFYFKKDVEEQIEQKERERIAKLYLTGADVERGIYKARGMDFDDIIEMVSKEIATGGALAMTLDLKALKIELKANNFYRGNPYVEAIGSLLGFSNEQLDEFFETNDYTVLLPKEEV